MSKKFLFAVLAATPGIGTQTGCDNSPPLDEKLIAEHEARGIKFSADKRTLVKYNKDLDLAKYTIPSSVKTIGDGAFKGCPCEASVKKQFPNYR